MVFDRSHGANQSGLDRSICVQNTLCLLSLSLPSRVCSTRLLSRESPAHESPPRSYETRTNTSDSEITRNKRAHGRLSSAQRPGHGPSRMLMQQNHGPTTACRWASRMLVNNRKTCERDTRASRKVSRARLNHSTIGFGRIGPVNLDEPRGRKWTSLRLCFRRCAVSLAPARVAPSSNFHLFLPPPFLPHPDRLSRPSTPTTPSFIVLRFARAKAIVSKF